MLEWKCSNVFADKVTFVVPEEIVYGMLNLCDCQEGTGSDVALYQRIDVKRPFLTTAIPL